VVEEGTPLFEIDPRPYEAQLRFSQGQMAANQAMVKRAKADNSRNKGLSVKSPGAVTQQELDQYQAAEDQAAANLETSRATFDTNRLNLSFTKITAPIRGRLSRPFIDPGNLVKEDDTILTRIVSLDPMYVYFDIDERTMLHLNRLENASADTSTKSKPEPLTATMGLADEDGYPRRGTLDFNENRVDSSTGTLRVRAVFANPDGLLAPGLFVRVRLPIGEPHEAILVPERAVGTDQGQKFLFVVDQKGEVEYRRVKVGRLHDGLRVITEGVAMGEKVVTNGLQRVRPGIKVAAKLVDAEPRASATQ
jgi:RND family efflux transporter MFP subunit